MRRSAVTDDIVTRLRNSYGQGCTCFAHHSFECSCVGAQWVEHYVEEAADEIERLRTENRAVKDAYEHLAEISKSQRETMTKYLFPQEEQQ